jgi:glycosyltransferase involved in cell wall biosynthesis
VGDGPARPDLEARTADLGLADRVEFRGWRSDLGSEFASFDVLAVPSRLEGFGMAAAEALLAGVPVVASRTGGLPEVVAHGETGLLVPPDDPVALAGALRTVLDGPEAAGGMAERGRELVLDRFSPAAMARAFEDLYDEVLR